MKITPNTSNNCNSTNVIWETSTWKRVGLHTAKTLIFLIGLTIFILSSIDQGQNTAAHGVDNKVQSAKSLCRESSLKVEGWTKKNMFLIFSLHLRLLQVIFYLICRRIFTSVTSPKVRLGGRFGEVKTSSKHAILVKVGQMRYTKKWEPIHTSLEENTMKKHHLPWRFTIFTLQNLHQSMAKNMFEDVFPTYDVRGPYLGGEGNVEMVLGLRFWWIVVFLYKGCKESNKTCEKTIISIHISYVCLRYVGGDLASWVLHLYSFLQEWEWDLASTAPITPTLKVLHCERQWGLLPVASLHGRRGTRYNLRKGKFPVDVVSWWTFFLQMFFLIGR